MTPEGVVVIDIKGISVIVDASDFEKIKESGPWRRHKGSRKQYFAHTTARPEHNTLLLHRFIVNAKDGDIVDHINGNTLDNRKCNLRICSQAENMKNQKLKQTNTSGYKGVSRNKYRTAWRARITVDGKEINLGEYIKREDAYRAYCEASAKYHGEFGRVV